MRELCVWYRVADAQAVPARRAALAMQAALRAEVPGLQARLLTRTGDDGTVQTWMETYALHRDHRGVDEAIEATIAARAASMLTLIDGERHSEAFLAETD